LRTQLPVKVSLPADTAAPVVDIRVSDETLDRYGEIINARRLASRKLSQEPSDPKRASIRRRHLHTRQSLQTEVVGSASCNVGNLRGRQSSAHRYGFIARLPE